MYVGTITFEVVCVYDDPITLKTLVALLFVEGGSISILELKDK